MTRPAVIACLVRRGATGVRSFVTAVLVAACGAAFGAAAVLPAQSTCRPSADSREARLLSFYAVSMAFSSALPAPALEAGGLAVALETSFVPTPAASLRQSDECFVPKSQNTGLSPVLPRPRLAVGLPGGVTAEMSYLPPVTVADATPSLLGLAFSYGVPVNSGLALLARVHGTVGYVEGPITCARASLQADAAQPCFGDTPSTDRYSPNVYGAELLGGVQLSERWRGLVGAGVTHARPRFQVGFTNGFGILDDTRIEANVNRVTGTLGVSRVITPRLQVGAIGYAVAGDAATIRLTAQWQAR